MFNHNAIEYKKIAQKGHRQRMCNRLEKQGVESLQDYEIVEMLLFLAFKRKDTKTLAKVLLKKFETLSGILHASKENITAIEGLSSNTYNVFKIVDAITKAILKDKIVKKNAVSCFEDVVNYCRINMRQLTIEEVRIIYLKSSGHVIEDEIIQKGTIDTVELYTREILRRCIEIGANGIVIVHNHPSYDPLPSPSDIACTKKVRDACELLNITLLDHVIIGGDNYVSFRNLLLL
ncbi:MAG: DNA repair protein RadC [Holosporales bacterium]|jgi:DNA repair protein RadC|nr:DNA repair protein RadC [Holosporales bacterium]